jgi:hypothetical protein
VRKEDTPMFGRRGSYTYIIKLSGNENVEVELFV